MVHRRDQRAEAVDRGDDVVVTEHHALRRTRRPAREDRARRSRRAWGAPRPRPAPPSRRETSGRVRPSGHRRSSSATGRAPHRVGQAHRGRSRGSGWRGAGRGDDTGDRVGRHSEVERDGDQPSPHGREVGRGELRAGRRPRQDPVAWFESERSQPPRRDPRPPLELVVRPCLERPVVATHRQRRPRADRATAESRSSSIVAGMAPPPKVRGIVPSVKRSRDATRARSSPATDAGARCGRKARVGVDLSTFDRAVRPSAMLRQPRMGFPSGGASGPVGREPDADIETHGLGR